MTLPDEMRNLTDHLREAHEARASAESARLAEAGEAARQRARDVDSLRASTASMLKELAGEIAAAHEVWAEFARGRAPSPAEVTAAPIPRAKRRGRLILGRGSRE